MKKNKTTENSSSVIDFLERLTDPTKKADCYSLMKLMEEQTGLEAKMWGAGIVGFGRYHYQYDSGHEGDAPLAAFAPRIAALVVYLAPDFLEKNELLTKLGKHKTGTSCLYIKKLEQIDAKVLAQLVRRSVATLKKRYPLSPN